MPHRLCEPGALLSRRYERAQRYRQDYAVRRGAIAGYCSERAWLAQCGKLDDQAKVQTTYAMQGLPR